MTAAVVSLFVSAFIPVFTFLVLWSAFRSLVKS